MADDNSTTKGDPKEGAGSTPPAGDSGSGELGKQVQTLTTQLSEAQTKLETANTRIKELEGSQGSLTAANNQANEKLTTAQAQLKDVQTQLDAKLAELTNMGTQMEQVNGQFGETTSKLTKTEQELALYKTIASTPEYHGLIGMVEGIKVVEDAEQQKTILDAMAQGIKGQVDSTLEIFKAGGSQTNVTTKTPGPTGPKNKEEAFARYQQIVGVPGFEQEAAGLMQFIQTAEAANGQA